MHYLKWDTLYVVFHLKIWMQIPFKLFVILKNVSSGLSTYFVSKDISFDDYRSSLDKYVSKILRVIFIF